MDTLVQLERGNIKNVKKLNLSGCGLFEIPDAVYLSADSLEILDISNNNISTLPPKLAELKKLRILFASNNPLRTVPIVLGNCMSLEMIGMRNCELTDIPAESLPPMLRWLIVTDNSLTRLPSELANLSRLQKLMVSCNKLSELPDLAKCQNLELLRIANNNFTSFPENVFCIPNLAWLAIAGNPLTEHDESRWISNEALKSIAFDDLQLGECLGEGASGHIWRANEKSPSADIAVKIFKSGNTSDGTPRSELAAGLAAGQHEGLVTPHATVSGAPNGRLAVALPLLPSHLVNLAGPPSFESCTRDTYDANATIPLDVANKLISSIEGALEHLHSRDVIHGDLYAHNILWNPADGTAVLSDFGAAAIASSLTQSQRASLIEMELRALNILKSEINKISSDHADACQ